MIARVDAAAVRPLRHAVLRPTQPPEAVAYPGDEDPGTWHGAALVDGLVVCVATFSAQPHPHDPRPGDWRLRGMATDPAHQGRGLGAAVLAAGTTHALTQGGARRLWCNARLAARGFYARAGWVAEGDVFEIDPIGPHVVMTR